MAVTHIHHINFLVLDLDAAIARYAQILGQAPTAAIVAELPARGVRTARFQVGAAWLVLVQPTDPNKVPGQHLATHGEGFFLISLAQDSPLESADAQRVRELGLDEKGIRNGLEDWRVWDIEPASTFGAQIQYCLSRQKEEKDY